MNKAINIPFDLEKGILFEDSGNLIKWEDDLEIIKRIDNPELNEDRSIIKWKNKLCFGGQIINVIVTIDNYKNKNGKLEFVDFEEEQSNPWDIYEKFSKYFKETIGNSSDFKKDIYDYPTELWNIKNIQIILGVGERFMDYSIFGIHYGENKKTNAQQRV
ncbi:MAG: hypothetical protein Tsb0033_19110 [Winogradskyella sp.]